jgi:uncharacterized membrane protein (DUF485 family)/nucleotide-binding universal stress UspA family protein
VAKAAETRGTGAAGSSASPGGAVLLATDGSLASVAATLRATDLVRETGADLHVIHVTTPESDLQVEFGEAGLESLEAHPVDGIAAARYLTTSAGVSAHFHELRGPVVESILEAARRVDAATIVMGETGPQPFGGTGVGSVAAAIGGRCSNRQVIIVPGNAAEVIPVVKEMLAADAPAVPGAASVDPDVDWTAMVDQPSFRELMAMKARFVVPVTVFALAFYLTVNALAGFARDFMSQSVIGALSVGYLLIIALYVMSWVIAVLYVRIANDKFDSKAADAIAGVAARRKNR